MDDSVDCSHEKIEEHYNFDDLGDEITCSCGKKFIIEYDEYWDGEEEYGWFFRTEVE